MAAGSATRSPILVPFEVLFVRRIKARQLRSVRDFIHDPGLHALLLRSDTNHLLDECGWDQQRAVVVNDDKIVGRDAHPPPHPFGPPKLRKVRPATEGGADAPWHQTERRVLRTPAMSRTTPSV